MLKTTRTEVIFIMSLVLFFVQFETTSAKNQTDAGIKPIIGSFTKIVKNTPKYHLRFLYAVLYDHEEQLSEEMKRRVKDRLGRFELVIERESLGKIDIHAYPVYVNVKNMGDELLSYQNRSCFTWIQDIWEFLGTKYEFEVFAFTPVCRIAWASDSHSIGYSFDGKACFSLEYYDYTEHDDMLACGLMIHKMMHGFGFNHQELYYQQLSLLNWQIGLPATLGLESEINGSYFNKIYFFNKHILEILGVYEKSQFSGNCIDHNGLKSISNHQKEGRAINSWDNKCMDIDQDNIVDIEDDYFLSSPKKGPDSDYDGIVNALDLCPYNKIIVSGNVQIGKINLIGVENNSEVTFNSDEVRITKIKISEMKFVHPRFKKWGFNCYFPKSSERVINQNRLILKREEFKSSVLRIEVHYVHKKKEYYRPFYFYFPNTMIYNIIHEREWFYFGRFGCDVPATLDFYDVDSYDSNHDGFLDNNEYGFVQKLPDDYDWDCDGFPDTVDTLPTVPGTYENEYVKGVKDTDGDGLADPGEIDFSYPPVPKLFFFGEFARKLGDNPDYDWSPYLSGSKKNKGCPDPDNDGIFWYDDSNPFN